MCMTCGCGKGQTLIGGHTLSRQRKPGEALHFRACQDESAHEREPALMHNHIDFGTGPAGAHAPGMSQSRMVTIERDIFAKNNDYADQNRRYFFVHGIFALKLVSSSGSGKMTLPVKTIEALNGSQSHAVIEGEDKPLKYPDKVRAADLMLLSKCDLLPHQDFDADLAVANARRQSADTGNPHIGRQRCGHGGMAGMDQRRLPRRDCCKAGNDSGLMPASPLIRACPAPCR